ncbi:MAG: GAF domain-containing protein [Candidatus Lokiarchaeota archaeon]|nr:GAF domain-containing protein [Candidatus Lokiarchaeota archaeon]
MIIKEIENNAVLKQKLSRILDYIKNLTSIEAIGIRLRFKEDYPFFIYDGFSKSFAKKASNLCSETEDFPEKCMCGNILKGEIDSNRSFFTKNGAFFINCSSKFMKLTKYSTEKQFCDFNGYESVALIPIRISKEIVGLIQLHDNRKNRFSRNLVRFLEIIALVIGLDLLKYSPFKNLIENQNTDNDKEVIISICSYCKRIQIVKNEWISLENCLNIIDHIYTDEFKFTHGVCPDCYDEQLSQF